MDQHYPERVRAFPAPGIWGYANRLGVPPGGRVRFHVCTPAAYDFSVVRLGTTAILDPAADERADRADIELLAEARRPAMPQTVSPGSYLYVEGPPIPTRPLTLALWLRPWRLPTIDTMQWNWSGLITDLNYPEACRVGLLLDHAGRICLYIGDGGPFRGEWLHCATRSVRDRLGTWMHLAATIGSDEVTIFIDGLEVYRGRIQAPLEPAPGSRARLRIGAGAERDAANNFLDGDIALPFVGHFVLESGDVRRLAADRGRTGIADLHAGEVLGDWPLEEEHGTHVADRSGRGRHAQIVNHGTWQIGGPGDDAAVDQARGHALRLSSDDLVDCGWTITDEFAVPADAEAGLYAARICLIGQDPLTALAIPFAVVRSAPRRQGSVALLLATNTWHAYGRIPRNDIRIPGLTSSFYTRHLNGRPFFHLGLQAPIPHANPYGFESERAAYTRHSHLVRPERFAQAWLEAEGYPYECLIDLDLHADPSVLANFQVLMICGHNEYWSDAMRDGVLAYLDQGGHVLCMSGNTLYWRVSFDDEMQVMESRKTSGTEDGEWLPPSQWGERRHGTDGRLGGTWQLLEQPTHEVIGLTMQGMVDDGTPTAFAAFQVEEPTHFLFHEPERVPVTEQGTIGERCLNGPKASGYEMDATPQVVGIAAEPTPGLVTLACARGQFSIEYAGADPFHGADLIYWERPGGGQVVNAGSIAFSGALAVDPGVRVLMRNVLSHFGVPRDDPSEIGQGRGHNLSMAHGPTN